MSSKVERLNLFNCQSKIMKILQLFAVCAILLSFQSLETGAQAPDYSQYILTPKAPDAPRINGPKVYGARPGAEFLFRIPATGIRPMTFEAEGLPKGLELDGQTGIIRGNVRRKGTWQVVLKAKNPAGECERELKIVIGDKIALTPPMGWSSWNCYGTGVTQEHAIATARAMLETGLADYGYTYVNIDDGWQGKRGGKENALQPNSAFPDMKALGDFLHDNGLKFGIYSSPWAGTFAGHAGSSCDSPDGKCWWMEEGSVTPYYQVDQTKISRDSLWYFGEYSFARQDARQWAEWGVDYVKYDWNAIDAWWLKDMRSALLATGRDMVFSLSCHTGYALGPVLQEYSECWRTGGDVKDSWRRIRNAGIRQERWAGYTRPGSWPDADMLVIGKVGWGPGGMREFERHWTHLTPDEQYSHVSLWALLSSPLLIGCDLTEIDDFTLSLLTNNEVIEVNQDPLAFQAAKFDGDENHAVYVKPLEDGSVAIGLFNFSDEPMMLGFRPHNLDLIGSQTIRDIWRQKDIDKILQTDWWETKVAPHGVTLLKVSPGNSGEKLVGRKPFTNKITKKSSVVVDQTVDMAQIRVGTYNLRISGAKDYENGNGWDTRKAKVVASVRKNDFDIFGIQEVTGNGNEGPEVGRNMQADLIAELGDTYEFIFFSPYSQDGVGKSSNGIAYKRDLFDISDKRFFWAAENPEVMTANDRKHHRGGLCAVFTHKQSGVRFFFMETHGPLYKECNPLVAPYYVEIEKKYNPGCLPSIFVGDMNFYDSSEGYGIFTAWWQDAYKVLQPKGGTTGPRGTFNGFNLERDMTKAGRIDYIFFRGQVVPVHYVCDDSRQDGRYPSDHCPVYCDVKLFCEN